MGGAYGRRWSDGEGGCLWGGACGLKQGGRRLKSALRAAATKPASADWDAPLCGGPTSRRKVPYTSNFATYLAGLGVRWRGVLVENSCKWMVHRVAVVWIMGR